MHAYISLAAENAREQELLSSYEIGRFVYDYARSLVEQTDGLEYGGTLVGHRYPLLQDFSENEYTLLPPRERYRAERERIYKFMGEERALWRVILRPLQGRISLARMQEFCARLQDLEGDDATINQRKIKEAVSVVPYSSLSHPVWGVIATDHGRSEGGSVRIPHLGGPFERRKAELYEDCDKAIGLGDHAGSQYVQELYFDDGALSSFRYSWDLESEGGQRQPPHVIFISWNSYMDSLPLFFQVPLFEMNPGIALDCDNIRKLTT